MVKNPISPPLLVNNNLISNFRENATSLTIFLFNNANLWLKIAFFQQIKYSIHKIDWGILLPLHKISRAFNVNPSLEVRGAFLDLPKAFDRVWYHGLLYKLENNRIDSNLFKFTKSFLNNRFQQNFLSDQSSV